MESIGFFLSTSEYCQNMRSSGQYMTAASQAEGKHV